MLFAFLTLRVFPYRSSQPAPLPCTWAVQFMFILPLACLFAFTVMILSVRSVLLAPEHPV